jgi:predicted membrane channel-forming protein YqfA (hemolysin III family)
MGCMKENMDMLVYRTSFYMAPLMLSSKWHAITSLSRKGEGDTHVIPYGYICVIIATLYKPAQLFS